VVSVSAVLGLVPRPLRALLIKHGELLKFTIVGGICFGVTNVVTYGLRLTVLVGRPITALAIGVLVATVVSYVLNREWSFRTRGGRERSHEAALFFLISGLAVVVNLIPLYLSRYAFHLEVPYVNRFVQETADFVSGSVVGMLLAMVFRFWGFKKWVFPDELGQRRRDATVTQLRPVKAKSD